jgi:hypothetical protein
MAGPYLPAAMACSSPYLQQTEVLQAEPATLEQELLGGTPAESSTTAHLSASSALEQQEQRFCTLQACTRRAFVDVKTGHVHDYCGRTHAAIALEQQGKGARLFSG